MSAGLHSFYVLVTLLLTIILGNAPSLLIRYVFVKAPLKKLRAFVITLVWGIIYTLLYGSLMLSYEPSITTFKLSSLVNLSMGVFYLILIKNGTVHENELPVNKEPTFAKSIVRRQIAPQIKINKNHWVFVLILSILLTIIVGQYVYHKGKYATYNDTKVENCRRLGEMYRNKENNNGKDLSYGVPIYTYNSELDTCIYRGIHVSESLFSKYILDLNTNKTIISSYYQNDTLIDGVTIQDFTNKEQELFNN